MKLRHSLTDTQERFALCNGTLRRAPYLALGLTLFAVKFAIDWTVARTFHRPWSPADYIVPGASLGMLIANPQERLFYSTMLLIALPFIAAGVWLTAMRLRSVGVTSGWTVLFFVPAINFALFALLTALPQRPRTKRVVSVEQINPAPPAGAATPLSYSDIPEPPLSRLDRLLPGNPAAVKAVAVFVPAAVGLAATVLSVYFFREYGWGVFVGVPFAIGLMAAVIFAARGTPGTRQCIAVGCLSLTVYGMGLVLFAFEGAACILMAAPLAYPIAIVGSLVGASLGARPSRVSDARRVIWVLLLFLPVFMGAESLSAPEAPTYAVTTAVDVDAPPERVWANVIGFRQIPPPTDWLFRAGVAYPIRAEIRGRGPAALRMCVFSTGAFVEPITDWNEPRLLKFSVTSNPPPMKEWSPWAGVHPPHLENFLVSNGGQFELIELPGGRTRLAGTTWYKHHMWPAAYWRLWSDSIIHRIHLRVLNHVKRLSEEHTQE